MPRHRHHQTPRRTFQRGQDSRAGRFGATTGLARALSKLGFCSRAQAFDLVHAGHVKVNGVLTHNPEQPTRLNHDRIEVDGAIIRPQTRVYLLLNKPRGLVTTTADERGRPTVFDCLKPLSAEGLPRVVPVGRLDQASEGLLLFSNDTTWAARITDPAGHLDKTYHVQVDCVADDALCRRIETGVNDAGELLQARRASVLRQGGKNSWLEIVLDEGRNRHIRRLLAALGVNVLRLVRVALGPLALGHLPKGAVRHLTAAEVRLLA